MTPGSNPPANEPLTIVIGCDTFPPDINGAARFAERLAAGLARHGHDVHIVASSFDGTHGAFTEIHDGQAMTVHRIKSYRIPQHKTLRYVWPFTLKAKTDEILRQVKPDAVHIQSHLIMGRYLAKSAREQGIRLLATNHIMPENLIKYSVIVPKFLEKTAMKLAWADAGRVLRQADFVTTPTRRAANLLEQAAGVTDVLAISCGIDASKFANATPTTNENPRILFLGRLDYEKHIHNLLKAVAMLPKKLNTQVEIVGDGGERKHLENLALELGISKQVTFLGHISEEELPKAYERATLFAMPSIAELQSIATMEAMASGRPVVAANAMALPHLVHDGDNGYLFEPDDVQEFSEKLRKILTADQAELDRLSENSLHLIQSHDIERTLSIFEGLYRGDQDSDRTSDDNSETYTQAIGLLPEQLHNRVVELRERAKALREAAAELREEVVEDVREKLEDIRDEVKKSAKKTAIKAKKVVKNATERLKNDED
ncbi:glycosyltransferase [Rhodoluna lacicola]|uniref:D-inositol 3-phosphate glycosyltransferase n=1 Tax=Rhodoluna lacicola TaxID=529884 RepID=A0A060JMG7_9MICO|nr:glycosyltransferase [Rhodoluna lacicola]AIC47449.1 Glycosyltransferase [Rhodoluna lacicola]